ncbi:glutamine amidotransferase-like uncharacterized protein [Sphingobium sp. B2D3A]|uniref:BPL-N domain-containing protein n=1 Tax=unclassified Sphingobium TaxID=2611147 RepID=UPI0022251438|nr:MULTISPECIES: BPL-N domain-containing protein [unclassified Sphingobium]MCW2336806.1 glutamine amidotransferase-like uncharacterized protein [Sphingobium sp. B2D3A]MCW2386560.1 glutamine amidotransferase-like uncharacterized protein [Sphingobium sp. B2D3D]
MTLRAWFVILCSMAALCSQIAHAQPVIHVAVYRGAAGCDDCSETAKQAIQHVDPRYKVDFIGPEEPRDVTSANLRHYAIYVQPGGGQDIRAALKALGPRRIAAIRDFVSRGGGYLGICMGAYLADANNIGLIEDELDGEVGRPGFPITSSDDAAITVRWDGQSDSIFFQDGPYFRRSREAGFRPLGFYANGDVAAAAYTFGRGTVVLSGPHPEADKSWFESAGIPLHQMPKSRVLNALLKEFAY